MPPSGGDKPCNLAGGCRIDIWTGIIVFLFSWRNLLRKPFSSFREQRPRIHPGLCFSGENYWRISGAEKIFYFPVLKWFAEIPSMFHHAGRCLVVLPVWILEQKSTLQTVQFLLAGSKISNSSFRTKFTMRRKHVRIHSAEGWLWSGCCEQEEIHPVTGNPPRIHRTFCWRAF